MQIAAHMLLQLASRDVARARLKIGAVLRHLRLITSGYFINFMHTVFFLVIKHVLKQFRMIQLRVISHGTREVTSVVDIDFTQHNRHVSQSAGQLVEYALPS